MQQRPVPTLFVTANSPQSADALYCFRLHETGQGDPDPAHQTHMYMFTDMIYVFIHSLCPTPHMTDCRQCKTHNWSSVFRFKTDQGPLCPLVRTCAQLRCFERPQAGTDLLRYTERQAVSCSVEQACGGAVLLYNGQSVLHTGGLQAHVQAIPASKLCSFQAEQKHTTLRNSALIQEGPRDEQSLRITELVYTQHVSAYLQAKLALQGLHMATVGSSLCVCQLNQRQSFMSVHYTRTSLCGCRCKLHRSSTEVHFFT